MKITGLRGVRMHFCCWMMGCHVPKSQRFCFWTTTRCAAGTSNIWLKTGSPSPTMGRKGRQSQITIAQEAALCEWLEERFCRSPSQIRAYMGAKFNIHYSHSGCIKLLARLGFEYRKPKALPRVANVEKQAAFIAFYENLLNNLPADEAVYFSDAVHPEYSQSTIHIILPVSRKFSHNGSQ